MASGVLHNSIVAIQLKSTCCDSNSHDLRNNSLRFLSNSYALDFKLLGKGICGPGQQKVQGIQLSSSHASVVEPVSCTSNSTGNYNQKPLCIEEAIEAGKRISNIPVDMIYTSALLRAQMTAMLAVTQHRCKKVPIVMHDESNQAKAWSQFFSEETRKQSVPVITAWQLNERMALTRKRQPKDMVRRIHEWRRSYDIPPPNGESLEMCSQRAVAYFMENIERRLQSGKNIMVAAHGNSLRSIIMYLDKLTSQEVINLELSTGIPLLYIYIDGKNMKRGSPVGPTEACVYAYTRSLALYRQKLDEMLQ